MSTAITEPPAVAGMHRPLLHLLTTGELRRWSERCRAAGMTVGLVPTMGALHDGHRSLIRRARAECDRVAVSVFINPRQFGAGEDIERYPRAAKADLLVLAEEGADVVFLPTVAEMYAANAATTVHVADRLTAVLEGAFRPGHFDGVAVVVTKLFNACRPGRAYFGRKDAQQCAVVRQLAADLDTGVEVVLCPVVRDPDGLALSSRNVYLTAAQRERAVAIPRGLSRAVAAFAGGERAAAVLCGVVREEMEQAGITVDYVAAVQAASLEPVESVLPGCQILVAGRMADTRLIDVIHLGIDAAPVPVAPQGTWIPGVNGVQGRD